MKRMKMKKKPRNKKDKNSKISGKNSEKILNWELSKILPTEIN